MTREEAFKAAWFDGKKVARRGWYYHIERHADELVLIDRITGSRDDRPTFFANLAYYHLRPDHADGWEILDDKPTRIEQLVSEIEAKTKELRELVK